ncbi:ankyrin repeat-containing domain protein [Corynascus novoguineensis]|uniref:Ankyrin repeat-containing domain protein n=1 Tax=Corynascus novoguineensis TaxID=1126955 RepID=A0AAN7HSF5_9PEZI|nr:ankyrin repeat-containing domain protein [Corynascus novoguineensis]
MASITLYTTTICIKQFLQDLANAPAVLRRLSNDCELALHLLRDAKSRIDRRRHLEDDENAYRGIQVLLRRTVQGVFPLCLELRKEIATLSRAPTTRFEKSIRRIRQPLYVRRLNNLHSSIHSMLENIQRLEHASNAGMLDRIYERLLSIQSHPQDPSPSMQAQSAYRRESSAASLQSSLSLATFKLPFEDTGPGALVWAIRQKELDEVKMVLEFMEVNPNFIVPGDKGESPLHLAASLGQEGIVESLLRNGADINARDARNWSVLRSTCNDGDADHPDTVRILLDWGADPNESWLSGRTPLWYLAWHSRSPRTFALLISCGAHVVNHECYGDPIRPTALWAAVSNGKLESARELLEAGASPHVRDNTGGTLLHQASARPDADELASLLLQYGADPAATDRDGCQPIHRVAKAGRSKLVRSLLATGRVAADACDNSGITALMCAAGAGAERLVRCLVAEFGADVWAEDALGNDAFYYAAEAGYVSVAAYLLGASWRARSRRPDARENRMGGGRGRGDAESETDNGEPQRNEGEESANETNSDTIGENAPDTGLENHACRSMETPTERDINKRNQSRRTALYAAAKAGRRDMVKWLLGQGADPNLVMDENMPGLNGPVTLAAIADAAGHKEIANLIRRAQV